MTKLCILLLICSMTAVSADKAFAEKTWSVNTNSVITDMVAFQQNTVTGTVKEATTGDPLPGVTILVKGTTFGALSDVNGKFSITIPGREAILIFSFIGYTTQEIAATAGAVINVSLSVEITQISEVVVVGYGVQKKESVVGAITQVKSESLVKAGAPSITQAISGKLSGVLTMQASGEPGKDQAEIVVRGLSSWNGSAPLVLVDGVEREFKDVNPNEINTISVLKDASATAVFGAKGANGVILVNTKRGALGKPVMDFSISYGGQKATALPPFIDGYTTMSLRNVGLMNAQAFTDLVPENILNEYRTPSTPLNSLQYPSVDWYRLLVKPYAPQTMANLNIQGGIGFVKYFVALGYKDDGSYLKGLKIDELNLEFGQKRFNYRTNVDFSLTKTTVLSMNLGGELDVTRNGGVGNYWRKLQWASVSRYPAFWPDWVLEQVPDPDYPNEKGSRLATMQGDVYGSPYTDAFSTGPTSTFQRNTNTTVFLDLFLDQKLDFILNGLSAKGKISVSAYNQVQDMWGRYDLPNYRLFFDRIGTTQNPWFRAGEGAEIYQMNPLSYGAQASGQILQYSKNFYYETSLSYNNTFGKHNITALALANWQEKDIQLEFPYYNQAFVGRATYDYAHKYLLEFNLGYTGSERFAPGNRYGIFPAGAVGWVISEENFFKNAVPWMNKLKLRYSDGIVGSDYASTRWLYLSNWFYDPNGKLREDLAANKNAQWEEARKRDIGFEAGIFNNLFTLSVDLFDEQRTKMLLTPNNATMMVGNDFKMQNMGSMKKHGFEIEVMFNKTTASGLNYSVGGNFGFNENRVLFKDDLLYAEVHQKAIDKPLNTAFNGVELTGTGYFTSIDDIHNNPSPVGFNRANLGHYKYLDYKADGIINNRDLHPIKGIAYPPITWSLSSGLTYKGLAVSLMFMGNIDKYVQFNQAYEDEFSSGHWRLHETALDYWSPTNPGANHQTLQFFSANVPNLVWSGGTAEYGYTGLIEGRYWRKADYIRLKDVYVGYTFNTVFLKRTLGISGLEIYANANNLFTITRLPESDPERKELVDGVYPQLTALRFGTKINF